MKEALLILEQAVYAVQTNESALRAAKDTKALRKASAQKWSCLEAIQILRRHQAELKKGGAL